MFLRELWMVLHIMIPGTPWLGLQMVGPCNQCNLLIFIITIGRMFPIPILNPTTIMGWPSSKESLLEQRGLQELMVIPNVEDLLFLHHTSVMDLVLDLELLMFLLWYLNS